MNTTKALQAALRALEDHRNQLARANALNLVRQALDQAPVVDQVAGLFLHLRPADQARVIAAMEAMVPSGFVYLAPVDLTEATPARAPDAGHGSQPQPPRAAP